MPNDLEKRKNVSLTTCAAIPGGWGASGTATNPGQTQVTYNILVGFTTSGATVEGSATTAVKVDPGKTVNWNAEQRFAAEPGTLCVLRGVG